MNTALAALTRIANPFTDTTDVLLRGIIAEMAVHADLQPAHLIAASLRERSIAVPPVDAARLEVVVECLLAALSAAHVVSDGLHYTRAVYGLESEDRFAVACVGVDAWLASKTPQIEAWLTRRGVTIEGPPSGRRRVVGDFVNATTT